MNNCLKNAFTLIELLVVIAIIGILSGLIIVGMSSSVNSARIAKAQIFTSSLKDSMLMNLISEWKFDDSSSLGSDSWSNNNCTTNGAPVVYSGSSCIYGSCLSFNGSTDYLNCNNPANLNFTSAITISVWAKKNHTNPASYKGIIGKYNPIGGGTTSYRLGAYGDRVMLTLPLAGGNISSPAGSYSGTSWSNIVATYTGANVYLYIDGSLVQSIAATGNISSNTKNLVIGGDGDGAGGTEVGNAFGGIIDNIQMYNYGIPSSKIREQYYSGLNNLLAKEGINKTEYYKNIENLKTNIAVK